MFIIKLMKKKYVVAGISLVSLLALLGIAYLIYDGSTLFWVKYEDDEFSFSRPSSFNQIKKFKKSKYFCTKPDRRGLDSCISVEKLEGKYHPTEQRTTGGYLTDEDLSSVNVSGRNYKVYSDGDAAYYQYIYIYQPDDSAYYKVGFHTNTYSHWKIYRDTKTILSQIEFY